ncbi:MAG: sulfatase [Planctomycetota bacterium]
MSLVSKRSSVLGTLAMALWLVNPRSDAADRPNVLFIAVDDLRPEFGAYGASHVKSPNLDRLAKRGVTFLHAYCQQAVCSPSRSSVMTGTRPDTTKVWDLETHFRDALPDVVTVGEHFKSNGYFVQGMGKIYHGGFDDPQTWSVPWQAAEGQAYALRENRGPGAPKVAGKNKRKQRANKRGPAFEGADVPDGTFRDGFVADLAVESLQSLKKREQPFFLAVGFAKPHLPFVAPKRYWDLYDPMAIPLATNRFPPKGAPSYAILPGGELRSYRGIPNGSIPDDLSRQLKHGYYAAISYMDAQLGRVLDELDRLELTSNTIVVLWGDHGWKLGEHDAWCKHSNCENDTHASLLLASPGVKEAGAKADGLVEFVDIYPTLCDLAGLPLPSHLEGMSFRPLLEEPTRAWKKAAFSQYPRKQEGKNLMGYSMRTDRYRFTGWVDREDPSRIEAIELYDHQSDPEENINIADKPESRELVYQLQSQWKLGWKGAKP